MSIEMQIFVALLMLAGNAFFVGAEFGLVSSRRSNIELQALRGSAAAKVTLGAMEHVSLMLAGAQLGVTLCSLIFGAVGEPLAAHFLEYPFAALGISEELLHPVAFTIALIVMVYVHVVLGEMVPKNLALAGPTRAALWLTPPLVVFVRVTRPVVIALNAVANAAIRLVGIKPRRELASAFDRDEVAGFVKESHKEGLLSKDEEHLLSGALNFEQKTIAMVLLPTDTLVTISAVASTERFEQAAVESGYSRLPVTDAHGEISGYVHIKDLLMVPDDVRLKHVPTKIVRRLPEFTPQTTLRSALVKMQRAGAHLAKVSDEKGYTIGVVALEDMLEELVGDIRDNAQRTPARRPRT